MKHLRKFNEENNEEAGEHFTPREVIDLLTHMVFDPIKDNLPPVMTVYDPACGSGAFLNQALDFLIKEHQYIDELQTNLLGGGLVFPNIETTVLENNIYGVDLNEESVEIAKLSLWRSKKSQYKVVNGHAVSPVRSLGL